MASTKLSFLAVTVLLLQASWCALAQLGGHAAVMAVTSFEQGKEGGGPAACDGVYHSDQGLLAALSTQWYAGGRRCHKHISITTQTIHTVVAEVVDEVDGDNIVATSQAVWDALGFNTEAGEIAITWVDV